MSVVDIVFLTYNNMNIKHLCTYQNPITNLYVHILQLSPQAFTQKSCRQVLRRHVRRGAVGISPRLVHIRAGRDQHLQALRVAVLRRH